MKTYNKGTGETHFIIITFIIIIITFLIFALLNGNFFEQAKEIIKSIF